MMKKRKGRFRSVQEKRCVLQRLQIRREEMSEYRGMAGAPHLSASCHLIPPQDTTPWVQAALMEAGKEGEKISITALLLDRWRAAALLMPLLIY